MTHSGHPTLPPIFDDLRVGITLHDGETGAILDGNERLAELYGYSIAELRSMRVEDYTAPSTKFTQNEAVRRIRAAADGEPQRFEWQIQRRTEELRWVRVHLSPTTIDGRQCVLAEIEDISEYRARERRLRLLSRIIRHNLRNKTNVLLGYTTKVRSAVQDETVQEELETIVDITNEVGTLSDSVHQLEQIAEPDATERRVVDLPTVAKTCVEESRTEYPNAEIALERDGPIRISADEGLTYALMHAIENAIVHNDQTPPRVTVTVAEAAEGTRAIVTVTDNGPTIPPEEIDVLAESVETTSTYHGSGVGLWVIQWCVDSLGGTLSFAENEPRGNVVTISLPRADSDEIEH